MSDKERTIDEEKWIKHMIAAEANKPNAHLYFKNMAVTVDGELCIGMTHDTQHNRYSCTYMEVGGVRDFGGCRRWDIHGGSLDGLSDLRLDTVQQGIRKI